MAFRNKKKQVHVLKPIKVIVIFRIYAKTFDTDFSFLIYIGLVPVTGCTAQLSQFKEKICATIRRLDRLYFENFGRAFKTVTNRILCRYLTWN